MGKGKINSMGIRYYYIRIIYEQIKVKRYIEMFQMKLRINYIPTANFYK